MTRDAILATLFFLFFAALCFTARAQDLSAPPTRSYGDTTPEIQSRQREATGKPNEPVLQEPVRLRWKLQPGQRLYQELIVTQTSQCRVRGLDVATGLKYLVLSTFTVEEVASDGKIGLRQKIEATRLLEADAMARSVFTDLLTKLAGETFQVTLSPEMRIVAFHADQDAFSIAVAGNPMAGQPLMMASLVDRDGWMELNQLTFYQPGQTLTTSQRWQRPLTHSWGPLGSWRGQAEYRYEGERDGLDRIAYDLKLVHRPPDAAAAGSLPFQSSDARFQTEKAGGVIFFDRRRGRVERAAETFHVRGSMAMEFFGQKTPVGLVEQQDFQLRIYENRLGSR